MVTFGIDLGTFWDGMTLTQLFAMVDEELAVRRAAPAARQPASRDDLVAWARSAGGQVVVEG